TLKLDRLCSELSESTQEVRSCSSVLTRVALTAQSFSSLRPRKTGNLGTPSAGRLWYLNFTVAPTHSDGALQMRARIASSNPVPISNLTRAAPLRISHTNEPSVPAAFLLDFDDDRSVRPRALVLAGLRLVCFSTTPT